VALVVFTLGAFITGCMTLWFAHYLFGALNGDLSMTDRPRGVDAAEVPWQSEPAAYWFLVVLWAAAAVGSAKACAMCWHDALRLCRALRAHAARPTRPQIDAASTSTADSVVGG
jgi:hypothetical protein